MNEDLEKIIESCLEKIEKKISTLEDCLKAYPQYREELEPILLSAQMLKNVSPLTPPEFKVALREKFLTKARGKARKRESIFKLPRHKAVALLLAATLILLLVGIGYAASRETNPNSPLYPVKIALEKVKSVFAREPSQKLKLHLENANRRLQELKILKQKENEPQFKKIMHALNKEISEAKKLLNLLSPAERKQAENSIQQLIQEEKILRGMPPQKTPFKETEKKDTRERPGEESGKSEKGRGEQERMSENEDKEIPAQKNIPDTQHQP